MSDNNFMVKIVSYVAKIEYFCSCFDRKILFQNSYKSICWNTN